jgi:tetratricopeptide (TPR) repeat protein
MRNTLRKTRRLAPMLALIFIFTVVVEAYGLQTEKTANDAATLIGEGKRLMKAGEYVRAAGVFRQALPLVKSEAERVDLYFNLARTAAYLNDVAKTEEYLRALFENDADFKISEADHPQEFVQAFQKVRAEYWFAIRPDDEYREEAEKQVIANLSRKPSKRKIPTFLIIAAGVLVVAALVVLVFVPKKQDDPRETGSILIQNRSRGVIWYGIQGGVGGSLEPYADRAVTLQIGDYDITISSSTDTRTIRMTVYSGQQIQLRVDDAFWDVD